MRRLELGSLAVEGARTLWASAHRRFDRIWVRAHARALHLRRPTGFRFRGQEYRYYHHPYNATWRNERAVELPIVLAELERAGSKRVLEVGNVVGHYAARSHDVIDKFEVAPGVLNVDAASYQPIAPYDLIVSISTLEHVGWDDEPRDPPKVIATVEHLRSLLAAGGKAVITMPVGYNAFLDDALAAHGVGFDRAFYLQRTGARTWSEVAELPRAKYGKPFRGANVVVIGELDAAVS